MADEQIVTNIVARSDFSGLIADVQRTTAALAKLQQELSITNKTLAAQAGQIQKSFSDTLRSTGQFSSHFVTVGSDVEKFGRSLDGGKLKLKDYFRTWQAHTRTSGGLIRDLAKQQVALQNAVVQPLGKTADGLMKFNVQVPKGLDLVANKTILARKELQIYNKVIQDGGVQLINWGKNTQWAGRQLTVGLTVPIAAFGMAAAKAFREADQELVRLTKVYGGVAATSAVDLANVRKDVSQTARELAAAYGSSFKDTISLAADIAATGKTGNELLASTKETTRLAVLGEVDRQDAMKATLALQNAFKQNTTELAESINFLNAVENQTSTSLGDLIEAIPKAGPVVQSLGGDVKDLALYLTAMKEGGINASEGANALKSALASMINPTKVAREMFSGLGIDLGGIVTQNAGNLTATITALQSSLDKLNPLQKSQAIEQLFGKFQFARLSALFENLGKEGSQTLQVMDLMKASSADLANVAGRELSQITESASGKYQRALQTLKADLAGVGESFLNVQTFFLNLTSSVVKFIDMLPGPIKSMLTLVAGITALAGPIIMLTGVFANFIGYVIKGIGHLKSLFKGGEGFRLLTPEILAASKAGSLIEKTFYSDAAAADILSASLKNLITEFTILQQKAASGTISVKPTIATIAGTVAMAGTPNGGYRGVTVDPANPLVGNMGTRASAHMNPVGNMSEAERAAQTIFGMVPAPIPVNRKIGKNPQMYMSGGALPSIPGLTSIGGVSTGVVAEEAAKWHAMTGALAMQSEAEITALKREVLATGTVTTELSTSYQALLPEITSLTRLAAQEGAAIVAQVQAGAVSVDQARARIVALNTQVEAMIAETTANIAIAQGRSANLTTVPLTNQPVVDPRTGKSNMKELFHKTPTADLVNNVARALGAIRTSGGGYSTATTTQNRNQGGPIYYNDGSRSVVPGPNVNADVVPAMLTPGEFVVNRAAAQANLPLLQAINGGRGVGGINHIKGGIIPTLQNILSTLFSRKTAIGATRGVTTSSKGQKRTSGYNAFSTPGALTDGIGYPHFSGQKFWETKLGRELNRLYGLRLPKTVKGSKSQSEVNLHAIHPDFIDKYGASSGRSSTPDLSGASLINLGVSGKIDADKSYRILPAMSIRGSKEFNESLARGTATASQWRRINGSNLTDLALMLHSAGVPPRVIKDILARTANQINYRVIKNGNTPIGESEFGSIVFDASEEALLNSVSKKTGSWIGLNLGGKVPGRAMGGPVSGASPYLVGENGPELFVPQNSGKIIPGFNNGGQVQHLASGGQVMAMLLRMIPGIAGYQLGSQLTGGSMMGGMAGSIGGDVIGTALANKILNIGKAADQVTKKVSLSQKVLNVFSKSPKIGWIGAIVAGATALKSANDRINEHRRIINLAFGQTAESASKLGINYKSLNDQLKEFKEKTDLAAAAANAFYASSTLTNGLSITIDEFQKLKDSVKKELPDLIAVFDKANTDQVVEKASQLKAQFISGGMSAEKATNIIRALIESSDKSSMALQVLANEGFGSIVDKSTAAVKSVETFNSLVSTGNGDQLATAFNTMVTSAQEMEKSLIGTRDETGNVITASKAWQITLEKVNAIQGNSNKLSGYQYALLSSMTPELAKILNGTESTAAALSKWKIYLSGAKVELKSMTDEMAIAFATAQANLIGVLSSGKTGTDLDKIVTAINNANKASLTNKDVIQKNAQKSQDALKAEIQLHQDNIDKIKEEADARRKSLSRQSEDEDILTQIKKKQLEYQDALAMGDSATAAQAQLDLQMLQRGQEKTLALRAIDDKEKSDTAAQQAIIDSLQKKIDGTSKTLETQLAKVDSAVKKVADLQKLLSDITSFISSAGSITSAEELKQANILEKNARDLGFKDFKFGTLIPSASEQNAKDLIAKLLGPAAASLAYPSKTGVDNILSTIIKNGSLSTADVNTLHSNDILNKILKAVSPKNEISPSDLKTKTQDSYTQTYIKENAFAKYGITPKLGETITIGNQKYKISGYDKSLGEYFVNKLATGGPIKHYEPGGNVRGPGTGTSDSIPAMLSDGEYVIRASSVAKYGTGTFDALNAQRFAEGGIANTPKQISIGGGKFRPVKPIGSVWTDKNPYVAPDRKNYKTDEAYLKDLYPKYVDTSFYTPPEKEYGIDEIKSPMGTLSRFLDIARSQIGSGHNYKIHNRTFAEGNRDSDVNKYTIWANENYKLGNDIAYWCGAFIAWVAHMSGVDLSNKMFSSYQATKDYKKQGLFNDLNVKDNFKNLKKGDLAWFDWSENKDNYKAKGDGVPDHASIISKIFGKDIYTIGWWGNPFNSGADAVKEKKIEDKQHLFGSVSPSFARLAMGGPVKNYRPGGNVKGPGTTTSDSIPAMLSNGEYVIKADSVKKYGIEHLDAMNSGKFADGGMVGIPHYKWGGFASLKNLFKKRTTGRAAIAAGAWQLGEEAEKALSLKWGANENASGFSKWGRALSRVAFNTAQGGVAGLAGAGGPGGVGGSIFGLVEGLVGLAKDGSQYGVKGGTGVKQYPKSWGEKTRSTLTALDAKKQLSAITPSSIALETLITMGFGAGLDKTGKLIGKIIPKLPDKVQSVLYKPVNLYNQYANYFKAKKLVDNKWMGHGSSELGKFDPPLSGTSVLDGSYARDPHYGMGFFGTSSRAEADLYAGGYNVPGQWGESFGTINRITKIPFGKYIDYRNKNLKSQNYLLWKLLQGKDNHWARDVGLGMPDYRYAGEELGSLMNQAGTTGSIMPRIPAGQAPGDINNAIWLALNKPKGTVLEEETGFLLNKPLKGISGTSAMPNVAKSVFDDILGKNSAKYLSKYIGNIFGKTPKVKIKIDENLPKEFDGAYATWDKTILMPKTGITKETLLHETLHHVDAQTTHDSYNRLLKYIYKAEGKVGLDRFKKALNDVSEKDFYTRVNTALNNPRNNMLQYYARFKGHGEGYANDMSTSLAPLLNKKGFNFTSTYKNDSIYGGTLLTLLKASKDEGYEYLHDPQFLSGLEDSAINATPGALRKLKVWQDAVSMFGVGIKTSENSDAFKNLLKYAEQNRLASGGYVNKVPHYAIGGSVIKSLFSSLVKNSPKQLKNFLPRLLKQKVTPNEVKGSGSLLGSSFKTALKMSPSFIKDLMGIPYKSIYAIGKKIPGIKNIIPNPGFANPTSQFKNAYSYSKNGRSFKSDVIDTPRQPRVGAPATSDDWIPTQPIHHPAEAVGEFAAHLSNLMGKKIGTPISNKILTPTKNSLKSILGKIKNTGSSQLEYMSKNYFLDYYTPIGNIKALAKAKKLGFVNTNPASHSLQSMMTPELMRDISLPLEELFSKPFYHGGALGRLENRILPEMMDIATWGASSPNFGSIFNFDLFTTMNKMVAREYATLKNNEAGGELFEILFNSPKNMSKVWDMREGKKSLWSQNKKAYIALEKYLSSIMGKENAQIKLLGERVPGIAKREPNSGYDRSQGLQSINMAQAFAKIGLNGSSWLIDTIVHQGGGNMGDIAHPVIATLAPEKMVKSLTKLLPKDLLRYTMSDMTPKDVLESTLERFIYQYKKFGKIFPDIGQGTLGPGHIKGGTGAAKGGYISKYRIGGPVLADFEQTEDDSYWKFGQRTRPEKYVVDMPQWTPGYSIFGPGMDGDGGQRIPKPFSDGTNSRKKLISKPIPKMVATGGYVNPSYSANMSVPQFKDGINMVPADMLAMIHKNEAIVPAAMNPFNPNANNATMTPAVYNISMTNHAAEGMDVNVFADVTTRKVLAEIKKLDVQRASMNGIGRRV